MRNSSKAVRCTALIVALAAIVGAPEIVTPPPAAAIDGLQRTWKVSEFDVRWSKRVAAECPRDKHVIGGGAKVYDGGRKLVRLTWMVPSALGGSYLDRFWAEAEAPDRGEDFPWYVVAYAICAKKSDLVDYTIVPRSAESSNTFQTSFARCPTGTVAFGTGAGIFTGPEIDLRAADVPGSKAGQIGLQLNRTSGPLDISRATARESTTGYAGEWRLTSYAICAEPEDRVHFESTVDPGAEATDYCESGFTHGPGGGGGVADGGPVWLQKIYPHPDLRTVDVALTGPTYPSIGGVVAHQTCATVN